MKKTLIIPAIFFGLLVSCRPEENPEQLKAINQSLEYANGVMQEANNRVYYEFMEKKKELSTGVYAAVWEPRAIQIGRYSDSIRHFINIIKDELIKKSDRLKIDYVEVTKQLHNPEGIGGQLVNKLIAFKDSIQALFISDNRMARPYMQDLLKTIPLLPTYRDSLPEDKKREYKKNWLEKSFGKTSALMGMIMLNKIESDVLAMENALITYCISQISNGCNLLKFKYSAVIILSSSYIKPGQSIQVSAGLGELSSAADPIITINGNRVPLSDDAMAQYSFKPTGKSGKHHMPVTIEFIKPDGTKETVTKSLEYIIAEN
ncbi:MULTISPECIES: hypothetical protein [Niastella]|uniref:Gliding motility-associated protein GldM N-terminal domain-containing protein n=1 Tax=Niastella soli TaxID=2821487 RepID=A0ABS3YP01_9BACT|nr:hypothetical protein [Niastella soli]MBO9199584.1 hypothetical protein [Niastella soli]